MRAVILGLAGLVIASDAMGADYLRGSTYEGPSASYNWAGVYIGGQAGSANAEINFSGAAGSIAGNLARHSFLELSDADVAAGQEGAQISKWLSLPRTGASGTSYGGFIGYNSQWGEVVFSAELNYNRVSLSAQVFDLIGRRVMLDEFAYPVNLSGGASARITDYAGARLRMGYAVGWVLPYLTAGVALGRADYTKFATLSYDQPIDTQPPPPPPAPPPVTVPPTPPTPPTLPRPVPPSFGPVTKMKSKSGVLSVGYALGGGVDIGLFPGVFVRAEYEFVQLGNFGGITASINNFRVAAAVKF